MSSKPLTSRPVDLLYVLYFLMHIPVTLLIDCQALYPRYLLPSAISSIPEWYVGFSGDPLISGAMGYTGSPSEFAWFKSFLMLEITFQLPLFILCADGLWKG
ncbi:transmembrane protein 6/97 [Vararia minispora EC-137]|uniref:Transmembrane protein 6/97 n=1 Tax=Vararia minispora EC-137 TaxID=1314806 RepID=A0ACB8QKR5_9AGAM|nr:transmembrane protein 6/97 [Vararia minispora EC-137]